MGEFELLARIRERLPPPSPRVRLGSGDDAAIVVPEGATATSIDALVEGVHFRREWGSLAQIGHKALAVALSDLAAMGAEPGEAYVFLGVPPDLGEEDCLQLLDGIVATASRSGTTLAGGDVTRAPALTLATTVVGHATDPGLLITRAGARPGDALVLSGEIGAAAAGLLALERPEVVEDLPRPTAAAVRARQLEPGLRLEAGRALAAAGARAMIDLSDGLGGDAGHLAASSNVGLVIEATSIPIADGVAEIASAAGREPLELAAGGGEDYELLAALPPDRVEAAASALATAGEPRLTRIGHVVDGGGVEIRLRGGGLLPPAGYDQLG